MDPVTLSIIAGLSALPQAGVGIAQLIQGNKFRKEKRPTYDIPDQVKKSTSIAAREASRTRLPGQDKMEERLGSRTASGVSALKETADSPVDIGAGVTKLVGAENRALTDLDIAAANMFQQNQSRLQSALGVEAGYEDRKFQLNEFEPYMNAQRAAAQLSSAGTQNLYGGLQSGMTQGVGTFQNATYANELLARQTEWEKLKAMNAFKSTGGVVPTPPLTGPLF